MSEVATRGSATRGRGGFRGGRGGYRGSRGGKPHSSREEQENVPPLEEQGQLGELKAKYADKLPMMREVCEGASDEDLVFALVETNGDEVAAIEGITSGVYTWRCAGAAKLTLAGSISQWGEVQKKEKKPKAAAAPADSSTRGRGRGGLESRGRGRGAERGARGDRGGRGARAVSQANGTKHTEKTAPTTDSWETLTATNGDSAEPAKDWATEPGKDALESLETAQPKPAASAAPTQKAGGWASLFSKPAQPASTKADQIPAPAPEAAVEETNVPVAEPEPTTSIAAPEQSAEQHIPPPIEAIAVDDGPTELPSAPHSDIAANDVQPAGDELTKENVNKLPDASHPIASNTAASTVASTADGPVNPALPNVQAIRPGMSGHAASAVRAALGAGRTASYSRKLADQQEAVVMPGHNVHTTAVQFGKMGIDSDDPDAEDDREEPETRTQLPDDSPAAPRASLPPGPASEQPQPAPPVMAAPPAEPERERMPSGLPSAPQPLQEPSPQQPAAYPDQYRQYAHAQQQYDPFSQKPQQSQEPFSNQNPGQSQMPPTSQQEAYQQYYGREYNSYYGYGQGQEQQRSGSAFGTSAQEAPGQYATAGPRGYGSQDLQASGHNTPNPPGVAHQHQQSGHMQGQHAQPGYPYGGQYGAGYGSQYPQYGSYGSMGHGRYQHNHQYGANRPISDDARRQQQQQEEYYNQYGYAQNQGYSSSYGKSGMYGAPQHQYSHDQYSSSPGNSAFGGREAYGRAGSTQPTEPPQSTAPTSYGGHTQDPFGRTPSGFGQQHSAHGSEDPAKPTGPSPSLQGGRPGSAVQGQQQASLPHQGQQAFAGYPQYGGFGNQTNHSSYGGYGSNNAFAGYGAAYGRGGWANQYGSGQH